MERRKDVRSRIFEYLESQFSQAVTMQAQLRIITLQGKYADPVNIANPELWAGMVREIEIDADLDFGGTMTEDDMEGGLTQYCEHCGCEDMFIDNKEARQTCTFCGIVNSIDNGVVAWSRYINRYKRWNHFRKMFEICKLGQEEMILIELRFVAIERIFVERGLNVIIGRKYFPFYGCALKTICEELGIDLSKISAVKQPCLEKTKIKFKRDWEKMCAA